MFKNLFRITLRSLSKQGVFSIINILGLSIGLAVVLLFSLQNFKERSFDRSFKESKNIYRINSHTDNEIFASTANALAPALREMPEVIAAVRTIRREYDMVNNDITFSLIMCWADSAFFRLFDTQFILGTPEAVMSRPNVIAISELEAKRLFGDKDPLGQIFEFTNMRGVPPMEVVAVFKDYPQNSSFRDQHRVIAPFMYSHEVWIHRQITWIRSEYETFCLLAASADVELVNEKMQKIVSDATADKPGINWHPKLQRLTDIHLYSAKFTGATSLTQYSDIGKVKMLSLLSVIIILVACINYMNLSTARAQKRSKEIGISKTVGAQRSELIMRLTLETAIFTFISFVIAWFLARGLLPVFNDLVGEQLSFSLAFRPLFLCVALFIWIVTTLLAAAYPVLYISGFPPLTAIQNKFIPNSSHAIVRKILIVGQFAVAIVLITWVLVVQVQIKFVNNKDIGYNPHNVIGFWIHDSNPTALLDEYRALSSVEMLSRENQLGNIGLSENLLFKDGDDKTGFTINPNAAEPNYFDLMQMKFIAGSTYPAATLRDTIVTNPTTGAKVSVRVPQDDFTQIVLNRAAVDYLGIKPEDVIGQRVNARFGGQWGYPVVCGVIENYHYESLHRPIRGVCIHYGLGQHKRYLLLRVTEGNLQEKLKTYEEIYKKYFPNNFFIPEFLNDRVAKFYDGERRTARIAVIFSILAIFVACMGVFGLTAFMAEQRTREIGIRKVMGASVKNIVSLFTGDYFRLLCISLAIAIPAAWWVGNQYLQSFAYRISLSWWMFALAALITVVLTLLTVCVLAIKAAMSNPVKSIKIE